MASALAMRNSPRLHTCIAHQRLKERNRDDSCNAACETRHTHRATCTWKNNNYAYEMQEFDMETNQIYPGTGLGRKAMQQEVKCTHLPEGVLELGVWGPIPDSRSHGHI